MGDNPAGLGFLTQSEFDLGGVGGSAYGKFDKPGSSGDLNNTPSGLPELALATPLGKSGLSVGISVIPDAMLMADWHYPDPPGGLGGTTSYGLQTDKAEILVLRAAAGVAWQMTSKFSIGLSVGAVYNKNQLITPYVFQNLNAPDAGADGAKTLLDLNTSGLGWNGQIGALYQATTNLQFGLSWQNKYTVRTYGSAIGNAYDQFDAPPGTEATSFHYNAEVDNTFPDQFSLGSSWRFLPRWRVAADVDWIDWKNAFNTLPVKLSNGNSTAVTAALGSSLQDNIPLNWNSEFVYRVGLEYEIVDNLFLRAGYSYGKSPVPDSTLSPLTAAIMENTLTAGIGYSWQNWQVDLAYQYDLPVTHHVGTSSLLDGEYSNSSTQVAVNWLALTMSYKF
jgi:long-chain fatty acid transport protein